MSTFMQNSLNDKLRHIKFKATVTESGTVILDGNKPLTVSIKPIESEMGFRF
jgi:hypothetical protein